MNENFLDSGDEILEASFAAMRGREVPDGPPEMRIAGTVAALNAAEKKRPNFFSRVNNMKFITGMAASVLLVIGAVVAAVMMLRSPEVTCAEVVEVVRNARFMSCVVSTELVGKVPAVHMKILVNDQGQMQMRQEGENGVRMVMDMKAGRFVTLTPITRTAIVMEMKNLPKRSNPASMIDDFKNLQGKSATDLGRTDIDGRKAEKFAATQDGQDYVVWADPQSREPIRVDITVKQMDQSVTVSMTDFEFNPTVPADAFSMEIPKGYTVQTLNLVVPDMDNVEQNVADLLRGYAQKSDGKFPEKLDDLSAYMKLIMKHATTRSSQLDDSDMRLIVGCQAVKHYLGKLPKGQWKYSGDGKMMDDRQALIFWYKSAKGYRGLSGDLVFRDLSKTPQ